MVRRSGARAPPRACLGASGVLPAGPPWYYFVKVTNLSQKRAIVITHIWFETKPPKHVLDNGLPARLPPG